MTDEIKNTEYDDDQYAELYNKIHTILSTKIKVLVDNIRNTEMTDENADIFDTVVRDVFYDYDIDILLDSDEE